MGDGVVIDDLVPRGQDENLLVLTHPLPLRYQHLDVRQRLSRIAVLRLVAQRQRPVLLHEGVRHFEGDPLESWGRNKIDLKDGGSIFLAVVDLEVESLGEEYDFGVGPVLLGHLGIQF